jgi:hypothetical protein
MHPTIIPAVLYELEVFVICNKTFTNAEFLQMYSMSAIFVFESEFVFFVSNPILPFIQCHKFMIVLRLGGFFKICFVWREQRIVAENKFDVTVQKFLVLLFMVQSNFKYGNQFVRKILKHPDHVLVNIASILKNFFYGWTRKVSATGGKNLV